MNYSKKKILVIGSFNHQLADKCISWGEISIGLYPYLGDYHTVIINLQSLHDSDLTESIQEQFNKIRSQINEIIWANTKVICITAPTIKSKTFMHTSYEGLIPTMSNYHWCPIYLDFLKQSGESFEDKPRGNYFRYFKFVKKWSHFLNGWDMELYQLRRGSLVEPQFNILLRNLAKKPLSFEVMFTEPPSTIMSNSMLFLPPPSEINTEEAIDYLLQHERGVIEIKKTELPKWTENIMVPGEESIRKNIKKKEELKKQCEYALKEYNAKLLNLVNFKRLLTADGEELENIVEETFKLFGVNIKSGPKGKEDKIVVDPDTNSEVPIEITGVKRSIPEVKLNQLIGRLVDPKRIENIKCKCKGILIGNHYKNEPLTSNLNGRKIPFESDVVRKAEISKICLLSTVELFKAVNAKLKGENIEAFIKKIFNKPGEVIFQRPKI